MWIIFYGFNLGFPCIPAFFAGDLALLLPVDDLKLSRSRLADTAFTIKITRALLNPEYSTIMES